MDGPGVCMAEFSSNLSGARGDVANRSYTLIWDSGPRKFFHPAKKKEIAPPQKIQAKTLFSRKNWADLQIHDQNANSSTA